MAHLKRLLSDIKEWSMGTSHLCKVDKTMQKLIKGIDYHELFKLSENYHRGNPYESLVIAIISQQISDSAADSIIRRLKSLFDGRLPSPGRLLKTNGKRLRSAGISPQKLLYLKDLCKRIKNGSLELKKMNKLENEDIIGELDAVKGIGRWTAEMFLISNLGRLDVLPADDLGIRKAIKKAYGLRNLPERKSIEKISGDWAPYRTIAAIYLWRSLRK